MKYDKFGIFLENEDLSQYSGFKVGGKAEYLFIPNDSNGLINFLKLNKLPINIIGCGYNTLIKDGVIKGVTIITKNLKNFELYKNFVKVGCGVLNSYLFNSMKNKGIGNFEFLGCIPGTIGGACIMNAGCYDMEIKDIIKSIEAVDFNGNTVTLKKNDCGFGYRTSLINKDLILLNAIFDISKKADIFEINNKFKEMLQKKTITQPTSKNTCGSTFKNPKDIPAWKIIQKIGFQGCDFGGVKFSEKHANFLINFNNRSANKIEEVIKKTQEKAKNMLNIDLELEIKILGD